jgi:hypothetical protein
MKSERAYYIASGPSMQQLNRIFIRSCCQLSDGLNQRTLPCNPQGVSQVNRHHDANQWIKQLPSGDLCDPMDQAAVLHTGGLFEAHAETRSETRLIFDRILPTRLSTLRRCFPLIKQGTSSRAECAQGLQAPLSNNPTDTECRAAVSGDCRCESW